MKKIFISFAFCFLLFDICSAQTQWQRTIGGTGYDEASSIIQTTDGGYALAGYTSSFGAGDSNMYIVKLSSGGSLQWSRIVGGTSHDYASSIIQTTDGGYVVDGQAYNGMYYNGMYIVKLNSSGTIQWTRTRMGGGLYDYGNSIKQTADGGYVLAGDSIYFDSFMYIIKLDASGAPQWSTTLGILGNDYATSVIQTTDGGYVVAGNTYIGDYDICIAKLNGSGTLQWSKTIGGADEDIVYSLIQTTDGGYAVAGRTASFGASDIMYIVKLDASGSLQWTKTVGGVAEWAYCIIQTTDGGYAVAGLTWSFGAGGSDMYIVKLNSSGSLQWSKTVGGTNDELAYSIIQTTDGGYAVAGYTESFGAGNKDMYIVKLDASGNTCGNMTSPPSQSGSGGTVATRNLNVTYQIPTVTTPNPTVSTGGTVTTICLIGIQPISNEIPTSFQLYQNYPNPFNPVTKIKFSIPPYEGGKGDVSPLSERGEKGGFVTLIIYSALGTEIATLVNEPLKPGTYEVTWDASSYASGVYFYVLVAGEFSETRKMVLIK